MKSSERQFTVRLKESIGPDDARALAPSIIDIPGALNRTLPVTEQQEAGSIHLCIANGNSQINVACDPSGCEKMLAGCRNEVRFILICNGMPSTMPDEITDKFRKLVCGCFEKYEAFFANGDPP